LEGKPSEGKPLEIKPLEGKPLEGKPMEDDLVFGDLRIAADCQRAWARVLEDGDEDDDEEEDDDNEEGEDGHAGQPLHAHATGGRGSERGKERASREPLNSTGGRGSNWMLLQHEAGDRWVIVCCSVLQCVAVCYSVL
jgi:hypothetical protein